MSQRRQPPRSVRSATPGRIRRALGDSTQPTGDAGASYNRIYFSPTEFQHIVLTDYPNDAVATWGITGSETFGGAPPGGGPHLTYPYLVIAGVDTPTKSEAITINSNTCGYFEVTHRNGNEMFVVRPQGVRIFKYQSGLTQITSNAAFQSNRIGRWNEVNRAGAVVIPMAYGTGFPEPDWSLLGAGSWIGFMDVSGKAAANTIAVNAQGNLTINGTGGVTTIINTNWGSARLMADSSAGTAHANTNFVLQKWA